MLADGFAVGLGLCFSSAVGKRRDNEDKSAGAYCKQNPQSPAEAASVLSFGFGFGDSLNSYVIRAASWTFHIMIMLPQRSISPFPLSSSILYHI